MLGKLSLQKKPVQIANGTFLRCVKQVRPAQFSIESFFSNQMAKSYWTKMEPPEEIVGFCTEQKINLVLPYPMNETRLPFFWLSMKLEEIFTFMTSQKGSVWVLCIDAEEEKERALYRSEFSNTSLQYLIQAHVQLHAAKLTFFWKHCLEQLKSQDWEGEKFYFLDPKKLQMISKNFVQESKKHALRQITHIQNQDGAVSLLLQEQKGWGLGFVAIEKAEQIEEHFFKKVFTPTVSEWDINGTHELFIEIFAWVKSLLRIEKKVVIRLLSPYWPVHGIFFQEIAFLEKKFDCIFSQELSELFYGHSPIVSFFEFFWEKMVYSNQAYLLLDFSEYPRVFAVLKKVQ